MLPHTSQRPPIIEQIRAQVRGVPYRRPARRQNDPPPPPDPGDLHAMFTICTGNRWMELGEREPPAKMLFGEFWHQNELCILFADTNVGKSVLAVQIADSISRRRPVGPFGLGVKPAKLLYVDFELTTQQFYARYNGPKGSHNFADKFIRAGYNPGNHTHDPNYTHDELLLAGIEYKLRWTGATVLIIDNITCLRGGTENAAVALALMQRLKALKTELNLSILVLAHTPKRRNPARPLSADDLQGSKLLINFADSAFAIGRSSAQKGLCYLRQIKQRSTEQVYGDDNVCLCRIQKMRGFLRFRFLGNARERDHLLSPAALNHLQMAAKAIRLKTQGLSQRQIKTKLKLSLGTVNKLLKWAG